MNKEKILLIVPPVTSPKENRSFNANFPMGLGYIAATLEKNSYEVVVLDSLVEKIDQEIPLKNNKDLVQVGMSFDEIRDYIINCRPDYVGITSMFTIQANNAYRIAEIVKVVNSNIKVILGGAHATSEPEKVLQNRAIDFVIIGEGEKTILQLLNTIRNKLDLNQLPGIALRNNQDKVVINPRNNYVDLNDLPLPAWHLFPMEKYITSGERHGLTYDRKIRSAPVLTSRGCPFKCNFCSAYQLFGREYRYRSSEIVLNEIQRLINTYQINDVYLNDDQFLANKKRAISILDGIIERNFNVTLDAPNGISPWMLNSEIIKKMKQAGFWRILLAIESGNKWVLKNIINKPVNIDKLPEIVKKIKKNKMIASAFLVVGNISEKGVETFSQIKDSFDLIRYLKIQSVTISFLTPHAGSVMYDVAIQKGYLNQRYIDDFYNTPRISTHLWTSKELEELVVVERILLSINNMYLFFLFKVFVRGFWSIGSKLRYRLIYNFYILVKNRKFVKILFKKIMAQ